MKLPFYLIVILFLSCSRNQESKVPYKELSVILNKFNKAFAEGNLTILDSLTTDNYLHTNGNAKVISKDKWFNYLEKRNGQLESGALDVLEYNLTEQKIEFHGTTAIVTGKITVVIQDSLGKKKSQYRITNIWVYNGGWKRAGFHDGKIPG